MIPLAEIIPEIPNAAQTPTIVYNEFAGVNWLLFGIFALIALAILVIIIWQLWRAMNGFLVEFKDSGRAYEKHFSDKAITNGVFLKVKSKSGDMMFDLRGAPPVMAKRWRVFPMIKYFIDVRYPFSTTFVEKKLGTETHTEYKSPAELHEFIESSAEKELMTPHNQKALNAMTILAIVAGVGIGFILRSFF